MATIFYGQRVLRRVEIVYDKKKGSIPAFIYIFSSDIQGRGAFYCDRYINVFKIITIDPFSPTSSNKKILFFIFFPMTMQKYASRDLLTVKYTECELKL